MLPLLSIAPRPIQADISPLVLADRLITLAQQADRAGYRASATRLISAAYAVLDDEKAVPPRVRRGRPADQNGSAVSRRRPSMHRRRNTNVA